MGLAAQGAKPYGITGIVIGRLMNSIHTRRQRLFFDLFPFNASDSVLDLGCGGGGMLRYFASRAPEGNHAGIDISPEMVNLSRRVNRKSCREGKMRILESSAMALPFDEESFMLVSACETVTYWTDPARGLREALRVLRPGGSFCIVNRAPLPGSPWFEKVPFKSPNDYVRALESAGFSSAETDTARIAGWIFVRALK